MARMPSLKWYATALLEEAGTRNCESKASCPAVWTTWNPLPPCSRSTRSSPDSHVPSPSASTQTPHPAAGQTSSMTPSPSLSFPSVLKAALRTSIRVRGSTQVSWLHEVALVQQGSAPSATSVTETATSLLHLSGFVSSRTEDCRLTPPEIVRANFWVLVLAALTRFTQTLQVPRRIWLSAV